MKKKKTNILNLIETLKITFFEIEFSLIIQ